MGSHATWDDVAQSGDHVMTATQAQRKRTELIRVVSLGGGLASFSLTGHLHHFGRRLLVRQIRAL